MAYAVSASPQGQDEPAMPAWNWTSHCPIKKRVDAGFFRFHEISFWLHTGRLGNTKLEITPTLLGSDRQVMQFRPVVLAGGEGWRRILLRIPEDVAKLQNDPKFAAINDVPATSFDERTYLLFSFGIRIARENPVTTWSGPIYLDQLEFLQRTR